MSGRLRCALLGVALGAGLAPAAAPAQSVRATGATTARYITVRALVEDSVPVATTRGEGLLRRAADGTIVRCVTGETYCRFVRSGDALSTAPFIQDVTLSAWGFGQGLRLYAQLRGRAGLGGEPELWPRADDRFDLLVAYLELDRPRYRVRAGRQWKVSGLGYYNWDGVSALLRPLPGLQLEAFGGWSLARGLNEPITGGALQAIEAFAPDVRALLIGVQAGWRPGPLAGLSALWQREIRDDRRALYAERVAVDGFARQGRVRVDGTLEMDAALGRISDARLRAGVALPRDLATGLFVRRYRPYFDLWTIWGTFDPVGFTEVGSSLSWQPVGSALSATFDVARRGYPAAHAATTFGAARADGWRFGLAATWRPDTAWLASLAYRVDAGFGAGRNDLSAGVRRTLRDDTHIGARALLFERAFELRVGNGYVAGVGIDAGARLAPRIRLDGDVAIYRHIAGRTDAATVDWSQVRGSLRLEWTVGPEPGMARPMAGRQ